ncbi:hypothetical protein ACIGEL_04070 [Rossellomorea aquimaris]|uniref:hypothetical protein n=1 Tax=Rossellomorea aquimaris TaxID=189382 RepID=UPI0037C791BD
MDWKRWLALGSMMLALYSVYKGNRTERQRNREIGMSGEAATRYMLIQPHHKQPGLPHSIPPMGCGADS